MILETAVQDGKVMQDFESELPTTGGEYSQKVKAPPVVGDYGSKDCVNLPSSTAVSRMIDLFVITCEQSADQHAAAACKHLAHKKIVGVLGPKLRALGLQMILPMEEFQVMGFTAVLKALPRLRRHFKMLLQTILAMQPKKVLFVDAPDFNLRLAKALRKAGYKGTLIHYIAPSVWAWKKKRSEQMAKTLDLLLCIFPFEPPYFPQLKTVYTQMNSRVGNLAKPAPHLQGSEVALKQLNLSKLSDASGPEDADVRRSQKPNLEFICVYVGNPTLEAIQHHTYTQFPGKILALFPGSRPEEIKRNLPLMLDVAKKLPLTPYIATTNPALIQKLAPHIPIAPAYDLMKSATLAIAKCGTVTLELALHAIPTVVVYKISFLNHCIARMLFRINLPFYSLPNIILQKQVFPELISTHFTEENCLQAAQKLLENPGPCIALCQEVKKQLQTASPPSLKVISFLE